MKVEIRHRWNPSVIFTAEIPDDTPERLRVRAAVQIAVSQRADLSAANLRAADLRAANLTAVRDDYWAVLSAAPKEVEGLRLALIEGRVDGSTYHGSCACLVGTIANVRGEKYDNLGALQPNSRRPAEVFFLGIRKGDTPESNQHAAIALAWTDEWLFAMREAFGVKP